MILLRLNNQAQGKAPSRADETKGAPQQRDHSQRTKNATVYSYFTCYNYWLHYCCELVITKPAIYEIIIAYLTVVNNPS